MHAPLFHVSLLLRLHCSSGAHTRGSDTFVVDLEAPALCIADGPSRARAERLAGPEGLGLSAPGSGARTRCSSRSLSRVECRESSRGAVTALVHEVAVALGSPRVTETTP